ncbi:LysE family translocator [Geopsychrobacter electrodiphilus]|uniref:LysE family translocator n=1 Tax=Geopsychrobacter electrodiphilus TaxID=225196 RepID=UPI0003779F8A|nr:LysE family translocator [Geopsychrobacter electrodiphilus]
MIDSSLWTFIFFAGILTLTPGADTLLVIRNVLGGDVRTGILTTAGICSGLFFHALLSALGVSLILMASATLYSMLKIAGALYLGWLGVQSLRSAVKAEPELQVSAGHARPRSMRRSYVEGVMSNVLNPKTAVFYLAFLPQFIHPTDPVLLKSLFLAGIHFTMAFLWLSLVALLLDRYRSVLLSSALHRWLEGVCGVLLLGLGVRLMLAKR